MKYIGSFFRMNSISTKEIESQLLFFTRESLKHILLESKCGVPISQKTLKKALSEDEYAKTKELNPILAVYKKAKPNIYQSKHNKTWDETTFKKDLLISSNALLTLSTLKLANYYKNFKNIDSSLYSISKIYTKIAKLQLDFYYENLRNTDGFFVNKRNVSSSNTSYPDLLEISSDFSFADQAYMMVAYYTYSKQTDDLKESEDFKNFALEILDMFENRLELVYNESLNECSDICYAFNIMYDLSKNIKCKSILLNLSDFLLSQYLDYGIDEKDMSLATITALNLYLAYKNTNILTFKESFIDICKLFKTLFNEDLSSFIKSGDKKDIKYYNIELLLYIVDLLLLNKEVPEEKFDENYLCNYFKQSIINSSILSSYPSAPSLDNVERYKHFSSKANDLLDDIMFTLPDTTSPESNCLAPIYLKSTSYSKKKSSYSTSKTNFESFNNLFLDFIILDLFQDDYIKFIAPIPKANISSSKNKHSSKKNREFRSIENLESELNEMINPKATLSQKINNDKDLNKSINQTTETLNIESTKIENILDVTILNDNLPNNLSTIMYEELD
ncbi:MAG: hypothetical protein ACRC41_13740 [Sarcina sp.]